MSSSVSILSSISNTEAHLRLFLKCREPDHLEDMKAALLEAETHAARQAASGESAAREKVLKERQEVEEALRAEARAAAEAAATELRTVRRGAEEAAAAARQSELAAQMQHAAAARTLTLALALWS